MNPYPPENVVPLDGAAAQSSGVAQPPLLPLILAAAGNLGPGIPVGVCAANGDDSFSTLAGTDLILALRSSRTIGTAVGLVMERFDLDDDEAFEHLVRWSRKSSLTLRDLAEHLVEQSNVLRHLVLASRDRPEQGPRDLSVVPCVDAAEPRVRPGDAEPDRRQGRIDAERAKSSSS